VRLLLDTHALLWWLLEDSQLSGTACTAIQDRDNQVFLSAASVCEIAIKLSLNKLPVPDELSQGMLHAIDGSGFTPLPITLGHAYALRELPFHHRDPFDRLLVAQSMSENLALVTKDPLIRRYDVDWVW
jgi:PIN domain nuclease of toxin-antitoxin system